MRPSTCLSLTIYRTAYTSFINVLDYTTIVTPVTFANKEVDVVPSEFRPLTEEDRMNMDLCALEF